MSEQMTRPGSISPRQNRIVAALTPAELEPLMPHMTLTGLALGAALYDPGSAEGYGFSKRCKGYVQCAFVLRRPLRVRRANAGSDDQLALVKRRLMNHETFNSGREFVSEDGWEHRKAFVGFGPADEAILRELRPASLQYPDEVMDELYARWCSFRS